MRLISEKNGEKKGSKKDVCINAMCAKEMFHTGTSAIIKHPS